MIRTMDGKRTVCLAAVLVLVLSAPGAPGFAQDEEALSSTEESQPSSDEPIAIEMVRGIDLLNDQIAQQQELLKTAQTERERQLIQNHIRMLQKERRSLESLLHKLVGPNFEALQAAREEQAEHRAERYEKTLERDERFTQP